MTAIRMPTPSSFIGDRRSYQAWSRSATAARSRFRRRPPLPPRRPSAWDARDARSLDVARRRRCGPEPRHFSHERIIDAGLYGPSGVRAEGFEGLDDLVVARLSAVDAHEVAHRLDDLVGKLDRTSGPYAQGLVPM